MSRHRATASSNFARRSWRPARRSPTENRSSAFLRVEVTAGPDDAIEIASDIGEQDESYD
jgi:hypothetical protein